ncbi:Gfo/Idh/MocA family oxidoreductase [Curvibacter sp. CHRR-16]|uniref:Gfo/Idh/MocA family protein n=1 Tax=Curvibacter sp. CHRR-16 TaxID=2835872 RepID=UPI001BD9AF71|nr:Gfo/Idh/MocA family oxidoreductase [Curvibacter sp. CHRR-16]MBT0570541.1 Gfo/Idh/MocA family oxidoreductase [Curvibacter sp. CHRR-16]
MLTVCIVGGSGHYRYVLEGLDERIQLAAYAAGSLGEDMGKLETMLAERALQVPRFGHWQGMLDTVKPDIVAVNSHFGDHARISRECLQRGIHVFSEKPVATTLDELAALRAAHGASGQHFSAMFGIRCKPWFLTAHAAVSAGRIGAVRLMHAQKSYKLGTRPAFYTQRESCGGLIPWVGSHAIDWLQWFSGAHFLSVTARHSRQHNAGHGDLEVSAQCLFDMSHGIAATVSIDYLRPTTAPSHDDDRIRITGTRGVLEVRDKQVCLINDEAEGPQTLAQLPERSIFASFVDQVLGTADCIVSSDDAFNATLASLMAREAADTGNMQRFASERDMPNRAD